MKILKWTTNKTKKDIERNLIKTPDKKTGISNPNKENIDLTKNQIQQLVKSGDIDKAQSQSKSCFQVSNCSFKRF